MTPLPITPPEGTTLLAYRGSVAHNMHVSSDDPNSIDDVDLMGFVIPESRYYLGLSEWGSRGTKEIWEGQYDCVYYELRKAVSLLLQGNPNIVSMLWLEKEHYLRVEEPARKLIDNRDLFVGKHVYNSFAGYAHAQLEKMESRDPAELREYIAVTNELKYRGAHPNHKGQRFERPYKVLRLENGQTMSLETRLKLGGEAVNAFTTSNDVLLQKLASFHKKGENIGYMGDKRKHLVLEHGYDAKNAAHCIRLLRMCKEFLADGVMRVYRTTDAAELLDIKRGKWPLEDVKRHAQELFEDIKAARDNSPLPDGPQRDKVEALLVDILRSRL